MPDKLTIENARVASPKDGSPAVQAKTSNAGKTYAQFTAMWSSGRRNRQTQQPEYGPTKFVTVQVHGFKAQDVLANVRGGDRVNVTGDVSHFEWQSNQGPRDDWFMFADSVSLPVPRAEQGSNQQAPQGGQQGGGDPWNSAPQGGGFDIQSEEAPF